MSLILEWVSSNHSIVTAAATVIVAAAAAITAWLTRSLVRENKLLRMVGEDPKVIAYLAGDTKHPSLLNLILENVGRGPARNIEFGFNFDERFYGNGRVAPMNRSDRTPFGFLPQGERISMFFGSGVGLLGDDRLPPFQAKIQWQNLDGKQFEEEYEMDVRQFLGIYPPSASADHEIAESLKKIAKRLDKFSSAGSSGRLKVETMTASEAQQQRSKHYTEATTNPHGQPES